MNWLRSIGCVLAAPVVYGVACVPGLNVLMSTFPQLVNEAGGTYDVGLTLAVEGMQFVVLIICGYVSALIAGREELKHSLAVMLGMLAVGITVQMSFWDSMLVWHHFVFFFLIVIGVFLGTKLRLRQKGTAQSRVL